MPSGSSNAEAVQAQWDARKDKKAKRQQLRDGPVVDLAAQERLAEKRRKVEEIKWVREKGRREAAERKAKNEGGEELAKLCRTITSYVTHPKLEHIIDPLGNDTAVRKIPRNVTEANAQLSTIKSRIMAAKGSAFTRKSLLAAASFIEQVNNPDVTGLDLRGFGEHVYQNQEKIEVEVAEAECEMACRVQMPWWVRLMWEFGNMAYQKNNMNREMLAEWETGKK
jgi:hypothetical protein